MITDWEPLADALRGELQEYGGLLSLFDDQQNAILRREPDAVLATQDSIASQLKTINECRKQREAHVRDAAARVSESPESPLRALLVYFPETVRPLMQALLDEVNGLISRTRRRAKQNQMLLARSIEVAQQILQRVNPESVTRTYSARGRMNLAAAGASSRCIARS
jgi:flagellar biosynthesis/type III secretory pathway chaperone